LTIYSVDGVFTDLWMQAQTVDQPHHRGGFGAIWGDCASAWAGEIGGEVAGDWEI